MCEFCRPILLLVLLYGKQSCYLLQKLVYLGYTMYVALRGSFYFLYTSLNTDHYRAKQAINYNLEEGN